MKSDGKKGSKTKQLKFQIRKYFKEIENLLRETSKKDWYKKGRGKNDIIRTSFLFAKELELKRFYYPLWLKRFSNFVPAHWEYWRSVYHDLEIAEKSKIQLDQVLIDAAVMHPVFVVAKKAGRSQKLNVRQLSWLLSRPYFLEVSLYKQEIISTQTERGMSEKEIAKAIVVSHRVQEKLRKWYKRINFPKIREEDESTKLKETDASSLAKHKPHSVKGLR